MLLRYEVQRTRGAYGAVAVRLWYWTVVEAERGATPTTPVVPIRSLGMPKKGSYYHAGNPGRFFRTGWDNDYIVAIGSRPSEGHIVQTDFVNRARAK